MAEETPENLDLLITLEEIQKLSNKPLAEALALSIAIRATDAVRDYCGWRVAGSKSETITLTANGDRTIFLPSLHVTEITALAEGRPAVPLVDDVDYAWDTNGAVDRLTGRWNRLRRGITATITHGHSRCPGAIAQAITAAVARGTLVPANGVTNESTLGASVSYTRVSAGGPSATSMFIAHELDALERYRLRNRS